MNRIRQYVTLCLASFFIALGAASVGAGTCTPGYAFSEDPSVLGVDGFKFKMMLKVPRIYDNNTSKGSRKYQAQKIEGEMYLIYRSGEMPEVVITNLVNKTQKLSNGSQIKYRCRIDQDKIPTIVNYIGDNKKGLFKIGSIVFFLDADPNYNKGEDDPDNSLLVAVSGKSSTRKTWFAEFLGNAYKYLGYYYEYNTFSGNVAGTLGCGCYAYGHTSPTRVGGACGASSIVSDVAAVWGSWAASHKKAWSWRRCDYYQSCCGD